jgi:hypothetical protein
MDFNLFTGILRMNSDFQATDIKTQRKIVVEDEIVSALIDKYDVSSIAGNGTSTSKIVNVLNWLSSNTYHNGGMMANYKGKFDAISLLDRSYQKEQEDGLNCVCLSIILSSIYIALGMKAFPIWMMPYNPYDSDNHVVVNVYNEEQKKWVMVDPSFGAYFQNENGLILDSYEIRDVFSFQERPALNKEFSYNGTPKEEIEGMKNYYYTYMAKNSFSFIVHKEIIMRNMYESSNLYVIPKNYDPKLREKENLEFQVREYGENEWTRNRRDKIMNSKYEIILAENIFSVIYV